MSPDDWNSLGNLLERVIAAVWLGFITWQNQKLGQQNRVLEEKIDTHERKATTRARLRGETVRADEEGGTPFPLKEAERG